MSEILFLLLPIAFYSGWLAARKRYKKKPQPHSSKQNNQFIKGINYLLNEQPDKALEFFLNHRDIDEYTAQTFLLLGNSFRNRGEVDRALKVHQNLIARPNLNKTQRHAAMLALGKDFFTAGMLDRAETVFQELLAENPKNSGEACLPLRGIYEQLQDWDKAIKVSQCVERFQKTDQSNLIAHYFCEMAERDLTKGELYLAQQHIKEAKKSSNQAPRILLIQGHIAVYEKNYSSAFKYYKQTIKSDTRLLGLVFNKITEISAAIDGTDHLFSMLISEYNQSNNADILPYLLDLSKSDHQNTILYPLVKQELKDQTLSIQSILKSLELFEKTTSSGSSPTEKLALIQTALKNHTQGQLAFQCQHCGYKMHDYLWRCPVCHYWDTVDHV